MLYVSKSVQNFTGVPLVRGQIVTPSGARNDHLLFGDTTRWTYRYDGPEAELLMCDTDGCQERFVDEDALRQHRNLVHAPERDDCRKGQIERSRHKVEAEQAGDTIGGYPIEKVKKGPRGPVPYIATPR